MPIAHRVDLSSIHVVSVVSNGVSVESATEKETKVLGWGALWRWLLPVSIFLAAFIVSRKKTLKKAWPTALRARFLAYVTDIDERLLSADLSTEQRSELLAIRAQLQASLYGGREPGDVERRFHSTR